MVTTQHNERNMTSSSNHNNTAKHGTVKSVADISNNYGCNISKNSRQGVTNDDINENIYSRPIELAQSQAKLNESNITDAYKDVMTSSCPSSTLFRNFMTNYPVLKYSKSQ